MEEPNILRLSEGESCLSGSDDAPPDVSILIVGHVIVSPVLATEDLTTFMPIWLLMSLWWTCAVAMSLLLLPRIKGALIAYQRAPGMHSFGEAPVLPRRSAG